MPRCRVVLQGPLATVSSFANNYEFALSGPVTSQTQLQAVATAIGNAITTSTPFKAGMCTDTSVTVVKLLYYSGTGPATLVATAIAGAVGSPSPIHAPQVCVAASLRTGVSGRSYRGRLYVPYRGSGISAAGVVTTATQTLIANSVSAAVSAVGAAFTAQGLSAAWVVYSPKTGNMTPITTIMVGAQCDTIRHRNRNRSETYTSQAAPAVTLTLAPGADESLVESLFNAAVSFIPGLWDGAGHTTTSGYNIVKNVIADVLPREDAGDQDEEDSEGE